MNNEELRMLIDGYNRGEYSFAEVLLASGKSVKELIKFLKETGIELYVNVGFIEQGRGLDESVLKEILEDNR